MHRMEPTFLEVASGTARATMDGGPTLQESKWQFPARLKTPLASSWTAIHSEDPSLILIPKHLMRRRKPVLEYRPVPFGQAAFRREGRHCTVVSWGNCLEIAEQAAAQMDREGVDLEIIDLRTLVPCDWSTIERSLAKTGRLVVIHEDSRTCGFGEAVIAEMTIDPKRFQLFFAPPQLVARYDTHIPYHPDLRICCVAELGQGHKGDTFDIGVYLMPILDVVVPQLGEGLEEVLVQKLLKRPGDSSNGMNRSTLWRRTRQSSRSSRPMTGILKEWLVEEGKVVPSVRSSLVSRERRVRRCKPIPIATSRALRQQQPSAG